MGMVADVCAWETPPTRMDFATGEVQIWGISLEQPPDRLLHFRSTLSTEECARADRFVFERHRRRFVVSQGGLRQILGHYLQQSPQSLVFERTERGKPFLATSNSSSLKFNLSHSHELAIYAIMPDHEIGVDVEHVRHMPDAGQIARRFFSTDEQAALMALSVDQRDAAFFACWTRKEAFIKAIGQGLSYPLDAFSVSVEPQGSACLLDVKNHPQEAAAWHLHAFSPAPDYIAALAIRSPLSHIRYLWLE